MVMVVYRKVQGEEAELAQDCNLYWNSCQRHQYAHCRYPQEERTTVEELTQKSIRTAEITHRDTDSISVCRLCSENHPARKWARMLDAPLRQRHTGQAASAAHSNLDSSSNRSPSDYQGTTKGLAPWGHCREHTQLAESLGMRTT